MWNYKKQLCGLLGFVVVCSSTLEGCSVRSLTAGNQQTTLNLENCLTDGEVTISEGGSYLVTGTAAKGQLVVDAKEEAVHLIFDGVTLTNEADAAIVVKDAKQVTITLKEGSENTLSCTGEYDRTDEDTKNAVIFSKKNLTLEGEGALCINSEYGDGIKSKKDLTITGGTITVDVAGDGVEAKEHLQIEDGTFDIVCGGGSTNGKSHMENGPRGNGMRPGNGERPQNAAAGEGLEPKDLPQDGEKPENLPEGEQKEPPQGELPKEPTGTDTQTDTNTQAPTDTGTQNSDRTSEISAKGIKSDTSIAISGGTITINASDDAIHSNGTIQIDAGTFTLSSGDDAVHADSSLTVNGGSIQADKCYEGLEGVCITINAGTIDVNADDDGINAAGDSDETMDSQDIDKLTINGGNISICAGGDGIDTNGDLEINGGSIYVDGPSDNGNSAIDYGDGAKAVVTGGTLVAVGSSGMAESFDTSSTQGFMLVCLDQTAEAGSTVTLTDESGAELISYTAEKTFDCVEISSKEITKGSSYTLTVGDTSKKIEMKDIIYSDRTSRFEV